MTSYIPILQDSERKKVHSLEWAYIGSLCLTPVQFILMGIAIWKGFFNNDNSFFYIALPITFFILLVQFLLFDRLDKRINQTLEVINPLMWDRLTSNVNQKYGEYGSIAPLEDPAEIAPPDGSASNKSGKVLWSWKNLNKNEEFKIIVDKKTGEPFLDKVDEFILTDNTTKTTTAKTEPTVE